MPEDSQGQRKRVAYNVGFNKFVVFERNKYINIDLFIK
jgi:hypothetical protein